MAEPYNQSVHLPESKHLEEQINYYIGEINQQYNSKYSPEKDHEALLTNNNNNNTNDVVYHCQYCKKMHNNNTFDTFTQFPSLHRIYVAECANFLNNYQKHKTYFHHNVFEEMMARIWHPKNMHKFCFLE